MCAGGAVVVVGRREGSEERERCARYVCATQLQVSCRVVDLNGLNPGIGPQDAYPQWALDTIPPVQFTFLFPVNLLQRPTNQPLGIHDKRPTEPNSFLYIDLESGLSASAPLTTVHSLSSGTPTPHASSLSTRQSPLTLSPRVIYFIYTENVGA